MARVELSTDGGQTWQPARFTSAAEQYAWRCWEYFWHPRTTGTVTLLSRAIDVDGVPQPLEPEWNELGYANNAVAAVPVTVA